MGTFAVWAGALVIPGLGFVANLILRFKKAGFLTAGADWLLLLWIFDFGAAAAHTEFGKFIAHADLAASAAATFTVLGLIALVTWILVLVALEPKLAAAARTPKGWRMVASLVLWFGFSWAVVVALTGAHGLVFTLR